MQKLIAFARHVMAEQLAHGSGGDLEYIRLAEEALAEVQAPAKADCERCGASEAYDSIRWDGIGYLACEPCCEMVNRMPDPTDAKDAYD